MILLRKALLSFFAFILAGIAHASQTVEVVWPFNMGTNQANVFRELLQNANALQNKYSFVMINRPGAGGEVAAKFVETSNNFTILASTSSFYIRPLLFKNSYDTNNFQLLKQVCVDQPLVIFSKTHSSLNLKQNDVVNIGILPGSITQLLPIRISDSKPSIKFNLVPYKGTLDARNDMLGRHIQMNVDFLSKTILNGNIDSDVNILGITGSKSYGRAKTFESQDIKGLSEIVLDMFLFVNKNTKPEVVAELYSIFEKAATHNEKVKNVCEEDLGQLKFVPFNQLNQRHVYLQNSWTKYTKGVPLQ